MAVFKSKDNKELIVNCTCSCDDSVRLKIDKDDFDMYAIVSYINGSFYAEQDSTMWRVFVKKLKKIIAVIRNKDFYYAEICMTKDDFEEFKKYVNSI